MQICAHTNVTISWIQFSWLVMSTMKFGPLENSLLYVMIMQNNSYTIQEVLSIAQLLSFPPAGYSPGNKPLDGYLTNSEGGECLEGYKMAMNVQSLGNHHTT